MREPLSCALAFGQSFCGVGAPPKGGARRFGGAEGGRKGGTSGTSGTGEPAAEVYVLDNAGERRGPMPRSEAERFIANKEAREIID